jgi:hypothetical protein
VKLTERAPPYTPGVAPGLADTTAVRVSVWPGSRDDFGEGELLITTMGEEALSWKVIELIVLVPRFVTLKLIVERAPSMTELSNWVTESRYAAAVGDCPMAGGEAVRLWVRPEAEAVDHVRSKGKV